MASDHKNVNSCRQKEKKKTCPVEPALNSLLPFCCYSLYFPVFLQMF